MQRFKPFEKTTMPSEMAKSPSMNGNSPTTSGDSGKSSIASPPFLANDPLDGLDDVRDQLASISDAEEVTGNIHIPVDAPSPARVVLGFSSGLTPNGRLAFGLALLATLALSVWRLGIAAVDKFFR